MVWKIELRVDIAAANSVSMNSTMTMSGMDALMYSGIILSVLSAPPYLATSAAVAVVPPLFQKYTLVNAPTVYATPVVSRMNTAPIGMARFNAFESLAVMKRTIS